MARTVFEYERPAPHSMEVEQDPPPPVLLFRPPPSRVPQLPRGFGDPTLSLASWVSGWSLDRPEQTLGERIFEGLTWAMLGLCLAIWTVVGAVFWLPAVVRGVFLYSVHLLQSMLEGSRPVAAARALRDAVTFYPRGFVSATDAVRRADPRGFSGFRRNDRLQGRRLVRELVWAVLLWYSLLLLLGGPVWSPAEAWHWVVGGPALEVAGASLDRLAATVQQGVAAGAGLPDVVPIQQ